MPVKIRLMRIGARKRPFFRVVAVDERKKRTGGYLELLGTYDPLTKPKAIKLKQDRIDAWVKDGAQLSDGFLRIIGKAPQRPARKPKKAKKEAAPAPAAPAAKPEAAEEAATEVAPAEEATAEEAPTKSEPEAADSRTEVSTSQAPLNDSEEPEVETPAEPAPETETAEETPTTEEKSE